MRRKCLHCSLIYDEQMCPYCGGRLSTHVDESENDILNQPSWYFKQMKKGKDEGELIDFLDMLKVEMFL